MRRGQGLPLNTVIVAIVVVLVLVLVVLVFVAHASSFDRSAVSNRCDGPSCQLLQETGLANVKVSAPQTVVVGQSARFTVYDENQRFSRVTVEIVSSPATGQASGAPGASSASNATVHRVSFNGTDVPGTYEYRLVGIDPSGHRTVIETGSFSVVEPSASAGYAEASVSLPSTIPPSGPLLVAVEPTAAYERGVLVFSSGNRSIRILVANASDGSLAGELSGPLRAGAYALDPHRSSLVSGNGSAQALDPNTKAGFIVTDAIRCGSSSACPTAAPYCGYNGTLFACSASCVGAGGLAADGSACCADLRFNATAHECALKARPIKIVLVPVGSDPARLASLAGVWSRALERATPLSACNGSRVEIEALGNASCAASCALAAGGGPISEAAWNACLDRIGSCGRAKLPDADRIVGVTGSSGIAIDEPGGALVSFAARAELGGSRFVMAGSGAQNLTRLFLQTLGISYGLGPLACSDTGSIPRAACSGPNHLDCGPNCTLPFDPTDTAVDWNATCFSDANYSRPFVMGSCAGASVYGPAGSRILARTPAFERAMEGCS